MYGAILGDMIGAPYEFDRGNQTKEFPLFSQRSVFTDDSILTVAVAEALLDSLGKTDEETRCAVTDSMRRWCRRYPYPSGGYGSRFRGWLFSDKPQPYGSCGNGAAMRVAAAGWLADTMEECHRLARLSAEVTHNHPQGIKGAQSVASVIFLARTGSSKPAIRRYIVQAFGYDLSRTCDQIRPGYSHRETCQETVPEAITAFLEGTDFEDVIRTAVSLGGDCDTLACIAGSMAEAFYGVPEPLKDECRRRLPEDLLAVVDHFWETVSLRAQDAAETVQGTVRAVRKMQSEAEEIWPGWEIFRPIGKGSFGNVYEIRKTENGAVQKAALKVISVPADKSDVQAAYDSGNASTEEEVSTYFESQIKVLLQEVDTMEKLKGNRNIVEIQDKMVIPHKGWPGADILIRMELLTPLNKHLRDHPLNEEGVIELGIDMCRALEACQSEEPPILHRDIKQANIMVDDDGNYKLGDFGVARVMEGTMSAHTKAGTENYMAPEVLLMKGYFAAADIYSLGIVLYRFLNNNRNPFLPTEGTITAPLQEKATYARLAGKRINPPLNGTERLKAAVLKALEYDPAKRYQTAIEFRWALERCRNSSVPDTAENNLEEETMGSDSIDRWTEPVNTLQSEQNTVSSEAAGNHHSVIDYHPINQQSTERIGKKKSPLLLIPAGIVVLLSAFFIIFIILRPKSEPLQLRIIADKTSLTPGETIELSVNAGDDTIRQANNLKWSSNDESIAVVDDSGVVTAVSEGTASITATYHETDEERADVQEKQSAAITITVSAQEILAHISLEQESISVGDTTKAVFEMNDETISGDDNLKWESSDTSVAQVDSSGYITGISDGIAVIKGTYSDQSASSEVTVVGNSIHGLEPVDQNIVKQLSSDLNVGPWNRKQILQGIEWNTDKMDRYYVCNGKTIEAYDENGRFINSCNDVGDDKLASMDYYDGKIFSTMRTSNNGKFKLRIYDAESLELLLSTNLTDMYGKYKKDKKKYDANLIPSIDGIMIAPAIGGTDLRIYISYNVYYSIKDYLALNEEQVIFSYDYESSIRNSKEIFAAEEYNVNLGPIKHGIQTLEYDRSTGNIWCAVRQGLSNYSLYCIDGNTFQTIPNNKRAGWDCAHAGDGLCSLGNDLFYVLVPEYGDNYTSGVIVKTKLDELEHVD